MNALTNLLSTVRNALTPSPAPRRRQSANLVTAEAAEQRQLMSASAPSQGVKVQAENKPAEKVKAVEVKLDSKTDTSISEKSPQQGVKGAPSEVTTVTSNLSNGILVVRGTRSADHIDLVVSGTKINVESYNASNQLISRTGFTASQINKIVIVADSGDDIVHVSTAITKTTRIFGGFGNDDLYGGGGVDNIYGGGGDDDMYGRGGGDLIYGGAGANDYISGGTGSNTTYFGSPNRTRTMSTMEQEIFRLTNVERQKRGLPALKSDGRLANAAYLHSSTMAAQSRLIGNDSAHNHNLWGVDQPTPDSRIDYAGFDNNGWSENIAYGYTTAAAVVQGWINSPGHFRNMMDPNMTHLAWA